MGKKMVWCMSSRVLWLAIVMVGCERSEEKKNPPRADAAQAAQVSLPPPTAPAWGLPASAGFFTEITGAVGLQDKPPVWPDGLYVVPELTPGSVALFDFDNDGRLDIL